MPSCQGLSSDQPPSSPPHAPPAARLSRVTSAGFVDAGPLCRSLELALARRADVGRDVCSAGDETSPHAGARRVR